MRKEIRMAEVYRKDDHFQINLFWFDLTKKAQDQLREALNIPNDEVVTMVISEEIVINE